MVDFDLTHFKSTYRDYARGYTFYAKIENNIYFSDDNSYLVKTTSLPASTNDGGADAHWQGHKYQLATTPTYDDFTITFNIDPESDIRNKMLKWSVELNNPVNNQHGNPGDGSYFSDISLKHLNPQGEEIQKFNLIDAWPKSVGEVALDYSSKEISSFDVMFAYQYHTIDGIN